MNEKTTTVNLDQRAFNKVVRSRSTLFSIYSDCKFLLTTGLLQVNRINPESLVHNKFQHDKGLPIMSLALFANSAGLDQKPQNAAYDQGLLNVYRMKS